MRVVRLRRSLTAVRDAEQAGAGREWRHGWVVRGHWRNHWYPSLGDYRPRWITPYLKGLSGVSLICGDKATVIRAAPPGPADQPS